ncbi:carbohydrate ABC transporter permease [Globicatella sulfidifaciens]|mgnify:CR=1 FL=1|uniref:Carbohydrate ABC transporter permease n=1 Tax=Globicatella sulfidifaciens TaxID=136093 RepID=A0A7X8C5R4_9LACT|nr:carbohydrate ABC transporter permease [Globicatella sulfidifaciens]NLJ19488.1 carbohydrate ABC transporter permease [Globicatella sulfidifaciens]
MQLNVIKKSHQVFTQIKENKFRIKKIFFGTKLNDGLVGKLATYTVLLIFGFVFLYPLLYMLSVSFMSSLDLADSTIEWIPSSLYLSNYQLTWRALRLPNAYVTTILVAGSSTLALITSSALIGYGLARFEFPLKKLIFALLLFTYLAPKMLFFIPRYQIFTSLGLSGNMGSLLLPAFLGQGEQAALFILIFYQFFKMIPIALEEAAFLDGAGAFKTFYKIALPMVRPAFIIVGIYAFALYWNETLITSFYLGGNIQTVPMLLNSLEASFSNVVNSTSGIGDPSVNPNLSYTEAIVFSGTILSILPLVIMYLFVQKWFVKSIDQSGITGE